MVLEKILQSSVAQFEFSYAYLAPGHGVQQNVGPRSNVFIRRLQTFFYSCHVLNVCNGFIFVLTFLHL